VAPTTFVDNNFKSYPIAKKIFDPKISSMFLKKYIIFLFNNNFQFSFTSKLPGDSSGVIDLPLQMLNGKNGPLQLLSITILIPNQN